MRIGQILTGLTVLGLLAVGACGSDDDDSKGSAGSSGSAGSGGGGGSSGADGGGASGGTAGTGGLPGTECTTNAQCTAPEQCVQGKCDTVVTAQCQGKDYACGNGIDDDNDGLTDMNDPDCLGPCSNSESVFHNCIPGGGSAACKLDCYFDQDSGSGNDTCEWDHTCDPLGTAEATQCPYLCDKNPGCNLGSQTAGECIGACNASPSATNGTCSGLYAKQTDTCSNFCGPLTPNGCDCFGCCDVLGDGDYRFMGTTSNDTGKCEDATCTLEKAKAKDDVACQKCTPVASCLNTCGECELCPGKETLPESCSDGGCPTPECNPGQQPCGVPGCTEPCQTGYFCLTGCCVQEPQ